MIDDANDQHRDAERDQSHAEIARRRGLVMRSCSLSFWNTCAMVKPKLMSESDVRMTDISVRSALMRVR